MLFSVKAGSIAQCSTGNRVNWIREFRHQTKLGLREANELSKHLANFGEQNCGFVINTEYYPQFKFLESCRPILHGQCNIIKMVNAGAGFKETDIELDQILNKIDAKMCKPRKSADEILKQTAIKLIREGHLKHAKGVLEILI